MNVHIYIDPSYKDTLWCTQTLKGITEEATKKRYSIKVLEADNIYKVDLDKFFEHESKRILLILSTSVILSKKFNKFFSENSVHLLYINHQSTSNMYRYSNIIIDYYESMRKITDYLEGCGRNRIALYGIYPDSSTDLIKKNFFEDRNRHIQKYGNGENIFYRDSDDRENSAIDCFMQFERSIENYDAVICANDLIAKLLIDNLQKIGKRVPEDLYVVSFGDYILAQIGTPTITAVTVDHEQLGRQAIYTYSYLCKASADIYITAKVTPRLSIRESTAKSEYKPSKKTTVDAVDHSTSDFYRDLEIISVITFENMLTKCDKLDMQILIGVMNHMTYMQLSEKLFVSENVISYRVKRLCKLASIPSKSKLAEAANRFLSAEAVERYITKKLS